MASSKAIQHPKLDNNGRAVSIQHPTPASSPALWADTAATVVFIPGGPVPDVLNSIRLDSINPPETAAAWDTFIGHEGMAALDPLKVPSGKYPSAGAVILETDGRVWFLEPSNHYGGYVATFPKGRRDPGYTDAATAAKEAFEETGLLVKIGPHLCDTVRSTTVCRYFLARRIGGSPADMGWEAQSVRLAPSDQLRKLLPSLNDRPVVEALEARMDDALDWVSGRRTI